MKRGKFNYWGQDYEGLIIIETIDELAEYKERVEDNPSLGLVYKHWLEIVNDPTLTLVINPMNGISYFCIPQTTEIEFI